MSLLSRIKKLEVQAIPKCSDNHKIFQTYIDDEPEQSTSKCTTCGKGLSTFIVRVKPTSGIEE